MAAATLLVVGHLLLTTKRFLVTGRAGKADSRSAVSESYARPRFPGQGQLDMAFDKFRKCPLDDG